MPKSISLKEKWDLLVNKLTNQFADGDELNIDGIIYLIGVQELGKSHQEFKKDEKVNLMHIAICKLLEPYGYYEFEGRDEENWPHFKILKKLPSLNDREQQHLIKEAMIAYFSQNDYIDLQDTTA